MTCSYRSMSVARGNTDKRDAELLAIDVTELDNDISRREEWMVSQCIFTGKIVCLDGDTSEVVAEVDYSPISQSVVNPLWSAGSHMRPAQGFEDGHAPGVGGLRLLRRFDRDGQGCFGCLRECGQSSLRLRQAEHFARDDHTRACRVWRHASGQLSRICRSTLRKANTPTSTALRSTSFPRTKCSLRHRDCKEPSLMRESCRLMRRHPRCIPTRRRACRWSTTRKASISGR